MVNERRSKHVDVKNGAEINVKPELVIMSGIPGTGKSSTVDQLYAKSHQVICGDDIRLAMLGRLWVEEAEPLVMAHCLLAARAVMVRRFNLVFDEAMTDLESFKIWFNMARDMNYRVVLHSVKAPYGVCRGRREEFIRDNTEEPLVRMVQELRRDEPGMVALADEHRLTENGG